MTDSDEAEEAARGNNNNDNNNNNNSRDGDAAATSNEESLGEIWFDTMRRNRGQGNCGNSTPSSPTNSSAQEQENTSNSECATNSDSNCSRQGENENENETEQDMTEAETSETRTNLGSEEAKGESTETTTSQKRGYQSDDEGFNYTNTTSGSDESSAKGSKQRDPNQSSASYLDAIKLMDLHRKAQEIDNKERLQAKKKRKEEHRDHRKPQKKQRTQDTSKAKSSQEQPAKSKKPAASSSSPARPSTGDKPSASPKAQTPQPKVIQRLERNAREKERSGKITDQFHSLKQILQEAGVVVPKGTKGSILTIAYQYIVSMQQQQKQKDQDNAALKQQIDAFAKGSLGPQTAQALYWAAKNNGLEETAAIAQQTLAVSSLQQQQPQARAASPPCFDPLTVVQEQDYHKVWDTCPVGIAIATMGGTFLDCNQVFKRLLECSKDQLRAISIFHLLKAKTGQEEGGENSKSNLQMAFEQISRLLEGIQNPNADSAGPIVLPGSIQGHEHLSIAVSLIKCCEPDGSDAHQLCVTLLNSNSLEMTIVQPATLDPIKVMGPHSLSPKPPNPHHHQQHALATILTNAHRLPTTASSSLSSSNDDEQDKQQQLKQRELAGERDESSRFYAVG